MTLAIKRKISWFASISFGILLLLMPPGALSAFTGREHIYWIYVFALAFCAASALVPLAETAAGKLGAIDMPDFRKVHTVPMPRLGGLAIYLAVMLALWRGHAMTGQTLAIVAASSLIFFMGVADDCRGLSATLRLVIQLAAACIIVNSGLTFNSFQWLPAGQFISAMVTVVWLVGVTNAFNFLDGIDGLASGLGTVCAIFFMGIGWHTHQLQMSLLAAALAGACCGFLPANWSPARMFLGDSGSTFIGFVLASLAVYGGWATNNPAVAISTPLLILGVPIFDIIYITISRIKNGQVRNLKEWIEYVGKDHFHHRLLHLGLTVPTAAAFIILVNIILGLGAWTMHYTATAFGTILLLMQSVLILCIIAFLMLVGRDIKSSK